MTRSLAERLTDLSNEALAFVARDKVDALARQWLGGQYTLNSVPEGVAARVLALELALSVPSLMGLTAFDRVARAMKGRPPEDVAAAALLRKSRIRIGRIGGRMFQDIANGEIFVFLPEPFGDGIFDGVWLGLFTQIDTDTILAPRMPVPLDDAALAVARSFVRPGNLGLGNVVRCAEAVYRHILHNGVNPSGAEGAKAAPKLPFRPDTIPLDAMAAARAKQGGEADAEEIAEVRANASQDAVMASVLCAGIARGHGAPDLAKAYTWMAGVMIETLALREAHGSGRGILDAAGAALDAEAGKGKYHREARDLFNSLRERVRLSMVRPKADATELDRLVQRIRALRSKTVEQGCTESEALAAAEKVAELLDRYGLNLSELDLRKQSCQGIGVETNRKRRGPIDDCMAFIAALFDCRVWAETAEDSTLRYVFFGLPADVQASVYLHDLIVLAFASETAAFQAGDFYRQADTGHRRSATNSFQIGLAKGINRKLRALRLVRDMADGGSAGRALVPVKASMIDEEMERLGLTFHTRSASRRRVLPDAYKAGQEAGERFEYRPGIEQQ